MSLRPLVFLFYNNYFCQTLREKKVKFDLITPENDRTIGGGNVWSNSWLKGKKLGLYSEKYRVKSVGKWLS